MSSRELVVANPITVAPEAMPAFSPLKESSNTYVVSGVVPKTSIPNRKQSGAGLVHHSGNREVAQGNRKRLQDHLHGT